MAAYSKQSSEKTAEMEPVRFRPEGELRGLVDPAFEEHRERLRSLVASAQIEHVGSTSIPGAVTKGDLDLLVTVEPDAFNSAIAALRTSYAVHQPENWTPTYASFVDPAASMPPVGVQLVVRGTPDEAMFVGFRDALRADPALVERYNAFKVEHAGETYDVYTAAKDAFIGQLRGAIAAADPATSAGSTSVRVSRPGPMHHRDDDRPHEET